MKVKILVKIGELILGETFPGDGVRADMYLPIWLLAFAIVLLLGGAVLGIVAAVFFSPVAAVIAAGVSALGAAAVLCWRNQTIRMLPDDSFEYTTFLGNRRVYRFTDITALRQNSDSFTLLLGKDKVHIESCAVLSERLVARINGCLSE